MTYQAVKTYGHNFGLSVAFRQWRAHSHCSYLHGYALGVEVVFEAENLDDYNWVVDFGAMASFREKLTKKFDHKTLVAHDDPELAWFRRAEKRGIIQMEIVDNTGCEYFARIVFDMAENWINDEGLLVKVASVKISEHGANSAIYKK